MNCSRTLILALLQSSNTVGGYETALLNIGGLIMRHTVVYLNDDFETKIQRHLL